MDAAGVSACGIGLSSFFDPSKFTEKTKPGKVENNQKEKERIEAKYKAERALSDYEWSVREIDKVLKLLHDDPLAKEYRRILLSMANVDDIEIKKVGNIIYYRYFSKKEPYKMVQL